MDGAGWAAGALWLGLLTAISPCPLASNLAALSFLGRDVRPARALAGGLLYAAGRALAYVAVGALLAWGLFSAPGLSRGLQSWLSPLLGPLLVVVGLALLGSLPLPAWGGGRNREGWRRHMDRFGLWSALPMGFVFALAFCPLSAALFFGSLLPLGVASGRLVLAPLLYGLGSALPVVLFALVLVWAATAVGPLFARLARLEALLRRLTGAALVLIGVVLLWTRLWAPLLSD